MDKDTKQFDKLNKRLDGIAANMATKDDLKTQTKELKAFAEGQTENLARIIANTVAEPMEQNFNELKDHLEVREDVRVLKVEMKRIKEALHIS